MIWLTWRQHRREALIFAVFLVVIATYLILTGRAMYASYYQVTGGMSVALCQQQQQQSDLCNRLTSAFNTMYYSNLFGLAALLALPLLAGMFIGAPLVARELETGTFRLAWTQSVTRLRWLLTKIGVVTSGFLLVSAAYVLLFQWWNWPNSYSENVIGSPLLQLGGILPLAYMVFALALGLAMGALLRRAVPAIFATLVGYAAVALAIYNWGRPNWLPPVVTTWDPYLTDVKVVATSRDWVLYYGYVDKSGKHLDMPTLLPTCAPSGSVDLRPGSDFNACLHAHGWLSTIVWQPADRYWAFQGVESGVLVALALALVALTIWLVRRRIA